MSRWWPRGPRDGAAVLLRFACVPFFLVTRTLSQRVPGENVPRKSGVATTRARLRRSGVATTPATLWLHTVAI